MAKSPSLSDIAILRTALDHENITIDDHGYLHWDTDDTDPDEQWTNLCELQESFQPLGFYLDSSSDHDTIWGQVYHLPYE
jgi:hypothetical protein